MFHRVKPITFTTLALTALALAALGLIAPGCSNESASAETDKGAAQAAKATAQPEADKTAQPEADKTAQPTAAQPNGTTYGDGVKGASRVSIADLMADPKAYEGKTVQVEGTVADVCPKRGCWFEMAGQKPGDKVRFKVQDGVMVFPMDAKGKQAVAEGVVVAQTLSLEETRKYLEYQAKEYGKDDVDPASVTEPMTIVRLDGQGAVISDGK